MCVPRLLNGLHPFIALNLLICPELQRLLPIMAKHDEEVVLIREKQREKEKLFIFVNLKLNTLTTPHGHLCQKSRFTAQDIFIAPL